MGPDWLYRVLSDDLGRRVDSHHLRQRRAVRVVDSTHVEIDGGRYVNFSGNNYLGFTHHPRVIHALCSSAGAQGTGSGASGLITGYTEAHAAAEAAIAELKGTEAAVLLPSGYQANQAVVQTLAAVSDASSVGVRFLVDKLVHASLIDAIRAAQVPFRVFPHNHMGKLARLLAEAEANQIQVVVTESIFSMDGDAADLGALAAMKRGRPFVLFLDEAHGTGVYGNGGAGYAAELGMVGLADIAVVTLSKALGCVGAAVCGTKVFCHALLNHGRAYIYSTSVPAFVAEAARAAVGVMREEPGRQARVRELARVVRAEVGKVFEVPAGDSPIVPVILKEERAALGAARKLMGAGLLVCAVRPPTVPRGSSRLRVTLSCDHTDGEIERLVREVRGLAVGV